MGVLLAKDNDWILVHDIVRPCFRREDINKLLKEQPNIDGIALPGMPIGTPGMPGDKYEPYVIYQIINGKYSVFMTI